MDRQPPRPVHIWLISIAVCSLAIFLRLPSCYESLWLDELHSAWIISDGIGSVYQRSIIGHQSPCYYYVLWTWQELFGDSELLLRLNSVLLVAGACGVLCFGITNWTKSLLAGLVSGLVLASENNSIFFGTELRPFALVMFFSSISAVLFLRLLASQTRHENSFRWCCLLITILFSTVCQPTCLGVLCWLPACLCVVWFSRNPQQFLRINGSDVVMISLILITSMLLWQMTLRQSWNEKSMWGSFATARNWQQLWYIWNWVWLLLIPSIPVSMTLLVDGIRKRQISGKPILLGLGFLMAFTFLITGLYWCASRLDFVPVWHRRYFIAVLPLFACFAGGCVGFLQNRMDRSRTSVIMNVVFTCLIITGLGIDQGLLNKLRFYPVALAQRGEDWREAKLWLEKHTQPESLILLDSGLIEGQSWITPELFEKGNENRLEYLCFPFRGLYNLNRPLVPVATNLRPVVAQTDRFKPVYTVTRDTPTRVRRRVNGGKIKGFGRVSIVIPDEYVHTPVTSEK